MIPDNFAGALKAVRRRKGLTMLDVSELTGIALPIYKMIESGRIFPDREKLCVLCEALGLEWQTDRSNEALEDKISF